jgi:hypothetical protein
MSELKKPAEPHPYVPVYTERSERALPVYTERSEYVSTEPRERALTSPSAFPPCPLWFSEPGGRRFHRVPVPVLPSLPVMFTGISPGIAESQIPTHSPSLLANRGSAELEILPSPCKQRATLLSNRGKIPVVQPLRHPSRTTHPSSLPFSDHYAGCPILPDSPGTVGVDMECGGLPLLFWTVPPGPPGTSFLIATRAYSREKSTHCKQRVIAISNRHKIHFCNRSRRTMPRAMDSTQLSSQSGRTVGVNYV